MPAPRHVSAPLALLLLATAALTAPRASAKFISPQDIIREKPLRDVVATLLGAKTREEAGPAFEAVAKAASAADSAPEARFFLGYLYQYGVGTAQDPDKAIVEYTAAAGGGLPAAVNNLALLELATGKDPQAAAARVLRAAEGGYAAAQCSMGQLLSEGIPAAGIEKDAVKAREWFEKAAAGGDADAAWALADQDFNAKEPTDKTRSEAVRRAEQAVAAKHIPAMLGYGARLASGAGVNADGAKAEALLKTAGDLGSAQAFAALGTLYESGSGVKKDPQKAYSFYAKAAQSGDSSAYNKLGYFHENGLGVDRDEAKAADFYRKGADKNVGICMYNLAVFYDEGKGGLKKDPAEAFQLHYRAALTAFVPSQLALGTRYRDGKGVAVDAQAALAWYDRAMRNGDVTGAVNCASILERGSTGVQDLRAAAEIYQSAAKQGHPGAMTALGAMIEEGRGVTGDFKQVWMLYSRAAAANFEPAIQRLDALKKRLTPEQIKEAEAFAAAPVPAEEPAKQQK